MKLEIPDRQRWLVIAAGGLVALLVLDTILFTPLTRIWKEHSTEIATLRKKVTEGRALIQSGPQVERTWLEMQRNALPKDAAQAQGEAISALEGWARSANVQLDSQRWQWKRGGTDKYSLLEYRVDATGSLPTLSRFLYEMERSPMAFRVDSVDLAARDESGGRITLGLIITGLRLSPWTKQQ
jgi:hypothetical protein